MKNYTIDLTKRIEDQIQTAWQDNVDDDCIWWHGQWLSYRQLNNLALDCEQKLRDSGFCAGERIAILMPNSPNVLALSLACWRLGGTIAPMNGRLKPMNLIASIKLLNASAVFVMEGKLNAVEAKGFELMSGVPVVSTPLNAPIPSIKTKRKTPDNADGAVIFSTSGTSGAPKAVRCTHLNILSNLADIPAALPGIIVADSILLNALPNFHAFGCNVSGILSLAYGIRQALVPMPIPIANTIKTLTASKANLIVVVPTLLSLMLSELAKTDMHFAGIKLVVSGGDRLNTDLDEKCKKYFGIHISEGYGLTECSPVVAVNPPTDARKLGTVGPKFNHLEIEIRDRDGNKLDLHEEGVLWLKGDAVVDSYYKEDAITAERFKDGWFNTGDVVKIDEDGYIRIVDRATDIIIVGGFNVYPQEIEEVICSYPGVQSAVVVGESNKLTGEVPKAFVILKPGATVAQKDIIDHCKECLGHYKVPRKVAFVTEYPISSVGKILRRELRNRKI